MKRKGLTLVEVLVSALLFGIITGGVFAAFVSADKIYNSNSTLLELQEQTRLTMDGLTRELRKADNVAVDPLDGSLTFDLTGEQGIKYYYDINSKQAVREYPAGTLKIMGNNINSLGFVLNGSLLEIQLSSSKQVRGRTVNFPTAGNLIEQVRLRNE